MADLNRNPTRILIALCAALILLGLLGHFLLDISGGIQSDTFSLHTGCVLLGLGVIGGLLTPVFTLNLGTLISPSLCLSPPIQPPATLR